jgi:hypothetical protein
MADSGMTNDIHSMVIASDYRVPDPTKVWPLLERNKAALSDIGAHHVLVYTSTHDYGRVLVMIGVHSREPIVELLRSRIFFDWFDTAGVEDIPAVFAGEIIDRFAAAGIRKTWVFQAFDDDHEVLILQEFPDEESAREWIEHPDAAAQWMSRAGVGAYPPLFVGQMFDIMRIEA